MRFIGCHGMMKFKNSMKNIIIILLILLGFLGYQVKSLNSKLKISKQQNDEVISELNRLSLEYSNSLEILAQNSQKKERLNASIERKKREIYKNSDESSTTHTANYILERLREQENAK